MLSGMNCFDSSMEDISDPSDLSFRGARSANPEPRVSGFDASHRPGMTLNCYSAPFANVLQACTVPC
jgi:hypothetical protein